MKLPFEMRAGPRSSDPEGTGELVFGIRMMTATLLAATLASGLASRRFRHVLPHVIAEYGGDTFWAAAVFFGLRLVRPTARRHVIAAAALAIAVAVELSQLAHPPWLDALRQQPGAGLILGYGFLASDLFCYAAGVALAWGLDAGVQRVLLGYGRRLHYQPVVKRRLHSTSDASPLAALLLAQILPVLPPHRAKHARWGPRRRSSRLGRGPQRGTRAGVPLRGASPVSVRRRRFTTAC